LHTNVLSSSICDFFIASVFIVVLGGAQLLSFFRVQ
jgi:hypothetical protein